MQHFLESSPNVTNYVGLRGSNHFWRDNWRLVCLPYLRCMGQSDNVEILVRNISLLSFTEIY